jgi:hypothetical protein
MGPSVEEALDISGPECVTGGLQRGRVGAREKSIIEECDGAAAIV